MREWLGERLGWTRRTPTPSVRPAGPMRELIARERLRADRAGSVFSLVAFRPRITDAAANGHRPSRGGDPGAELAEILKLRLRATDDAGRLDDGRVAALLPDTPPAGARSLADDVLRRAHAAGHELECEIYVYPADANCEWNGPTRGQHSPAGDRGHDEESNGNGATPRGPFNGARRLGSNGLVPPNGGDGGGHVPSAHEENAGSAAPGEEALPLEMLFCRPLPAWKRAVDIVGAIVGLVALAPIMLAAAAAVRFTSPGPVLFSQRRLGLGGREFTLYKFRTMTDDAEARKKELWELNERDGPAFKLTNDPRVTPVGWFLRRSCIDELPQLWNVLVGEMSLVGPRPLECNEQTGRPRWERRRLEATPGLTCIWQVDGGSSVTHAEWMRMDIRYILRRGFWRDAVLIVRTIGKVLRMGGSP